MRNLQLRSLALALALVAFAPLALAGCIDVFFDDPDDPGQPDDPPVSETEARFTRDVYPILASRCGSCHSEGNPIGIGFVGKSPDDAYARVLSFPSVVGDFTPSAPILLLPTISHKGVIYTADEKAAVAAWLDAELVERGGVKPPPPPTLEMLAQIWSGCVDYSDFLASDMPAAWNALVTANGPCLSCHAAASGGFAVSSDPMEFFRLISTRRSTLLTFFAPDAAVSALLANHDLFIAVGSQRTPYNLHPAFPYTDARTALAAFADKTVARFKATPRACGAPRLED
ncbi:MAG TPA: hypothetical protein VNO30_43280 [Kofleriaceae bacterium]|nr:hypothetical protein [Kofleriaceae bacterium]